MWSESLIHLWTTTERVVELAWNKYVVNASQEPSKARRTFLVDHRTWPVSTKLELLYQKNLLPLNTYKLLDATRKARNAFAHEAIRPTHEVATQALRGCFELASLVASDFKVNNLFDKVVSMVVERCKPELYPSMADLNPTHWLKSPYLPLPGEKEWGDREFETMKEFELIPLNPVEIKKFEQAG